MSGRSLIVIGLVLASHGVLAAQFSQTVGVSGTANAGTAFSMQIEALPTFTRVINFAALPVDFTPLAMAQLMVTYINENFLQFGKSGFSAENPEKADGKSKYDATFKINCTVPITNILVGTYGNPTQPLPRAPGVGFNPNFINYESHLPTPYTPPQVGSPTADFRVNGQDPANEFNRVVEVPLSPITGGTLTLSFSSGPNANAGIMLLFGEFNPGHFPLPWGDVLDIGTTGTLPGGVAILADGIFQGTGHPLDVFFRTNAALPAVASFAATVPPTFAGMNAGGAFQAILSDPTNLPFLYRTTQAAQPRYEFGVATTLPVGTDGFAVVPFAGSQTFPFYSSTYTQLAVHENGVVSFGPGTGTVGAAIVNPLAALGAAPAIFANWADWDLSSAGGVGLYQFGDEVRLAWGSAAQPARHFGDVDQGRFEAILKLSGAPIANVEAGAVVLNFIHLDDAAIQRNDAVIGISAGQNLDPQPRSIDFAEETFTDTAFRSILSQENGGSLALSALPVVNSAGVGTPQLYHNGTRWNGREVSFFPPAANPNGLFSYAIATTDHPDDFRRVDPATPTLFRVIPTAQTLRLVGYFKYLFASGGPPAVLLDPNGDFGAPIPLQIAGVLYDGALPQPFPVAPIASGYRSYEGVVVTLQGPLPPTYLSGTSADIAVTFASGATITLDNAVMIQ